MPKYTKMSDKVHRPYGKEQTCGLSKEKSSDTSVTWKKGVGEGRRVSKKTVMTNT